jgi:hypothetical protein
VFLRTQASAAPGRRARPGLRFRGRLRALAGCVAVAAACAGCGATNPPPPLGKVVSGPIQILVTSQSVNRVGDPVGVTNYFPATSHAATAVAVLGKLSGPQELVMTWSRVTGAGSQVLFSQHMMVTSYGRAYTTAVTRGTMPFGTYEVTASVAGVTRTTEWAVFGPGHTTAADYATTVAPFAAGHPVAMPRPSRLGHLCDSQDTIAAMPTPNDMDLNVSVICPDTRANKVIRGVVLATMGHNLGLRLIGMMHTEPGGVIAGNFRFNVCSLPQGTDLPGARLGITTIVYYLGDTRDFTFVAGLPADLHGPDVTISSSVPAGSPVHPGEKIKLRVTATEPDRLGPQSGIGNVKVFASNRLIRFARYRKELTGCNMLRSDRVLNITYTVPHEAPKVITVMARTSNIPGSTAMTHISFPFAG